MRREEKMREKEREREGTWKCEGEGLLVQWRMCEEEGVRKGARVRRRRGCI